MAPVVCVQNMYGIGVRREQDALLRTCGEQGIAFVPFYSIAAAGGQAGASGAESEEVCAVARAHGASPAQVRLAWTLHRGAARAGHPRHRQSRPPGANVAAGALRLSEDDLAVLEALHRSAA
ncbi:aldo/keto reductase [Streptomyces sp. NBC_01310]|uniref:aldo/keto reductase n=1 Tax=Streptomyces sp. NBC_01310 TaxID=2903820 RepID=UPI0035B5ED27|nr:aldo/keto reductase [Streptomyces sp. NBC_01310]